MRDIKAGGAIVTVSAKEEMAAGLAVARQKIEAFAEHVKSKTGATLSNALSFRDIAQTLASGAVLAIIGKIALKNEQVAKSAEEAKNAFLAMVSEVTRELEGELKYGLETAAFLLGKMSEGFRAIIATAKDLFALVRGDSSFKNLNRVLDNLGKHDVIGKVEDKTQKASSATRELTEETKRLAKAQEDYVKALNAADIAGRGDIDSVLREIDVLRRGEANVKGDEIAQQVFDAEAKALRAKRVAQGGADVNTLADKGALDSAQKRADALREQYKFLVDQKAKLEEIKKQEEDRARSIQDAIEARQDEIRQQSETMQDAAQKASPVGTFSAQVAKMIPKINSEAKSQIEEAKKLKTIAEKQLEQLRAIASKVGVPSFG